MQNSKCSTLGSKRDYIPFLVDLYITNVCNMRCIHCNASAGEDGKELPLAKALAVIDEAYEMGTTNLAITGGEPFLHKQCMQIIRHACEKEGWLVSVNTNGTVLDKEIIERLASESKTAQLVFSLDGYNPATYGILRRLPSGIPADEFFSRVLANIEDCIKNSLNTTVNYDLTRLTLPHFLPTVDVVCKGLGVKLLGIKFFPHGRGFQNRERLEIPYRQWHDFLVQVTALAVQDTSFDDLVQISILCPWELYLPLIRAGYSKETIERIWDYKSPLAWERYSAFRNLGCDGGVTHCAINADGYLTTCGTVPTLERLYAGNVMDRSFSNIWENSDVLSGVRNQQLEDIGEPCISCSLKYICGGGCRARALVLSGSLRSGDPGCPIVETYLSEREGE